MYKKQVFKSDTFANQKIGLYLHSFAGVVELVDTLDLGSSAARRGGSTPFTRTKKQALIIDIQWLRFFYFLFFGKF